MTFVTTDTRDKLLAGLSENSRRVYQSVFDEFWLFACSRYSAPSSADPLVWLSRHRAEELKPHAPDPLCCERVVTEWMTSLNDSDLAPSSAVRYRAVISALFGRFSRVPLRLPLEPEGGVS